MKSVLYIMVFVSLSMGSNINYIDSVTNPERLILLDTASRTFFVDKECGDYLSTCVDKDSLVSTFAPRLYNFASWLVMREPRYTRIIQQLEKRTISFFGPDTFKIAPSIYPIAGKKNAPVVITAYIKADCSICKAVVIPLYLSVIEGGLLEGVAQLQVKNLSAGEGELGLAVAATHDKFWDFFLELENVEGKLDMRSLVKTARRVGISTEQFQQTIKQKKLRDAIYKSRMEAKGNDVDVTPTLFINNKRYRSYKNPQWVIDAVEFEYEYMKRNK